MNRLGPIISSSSRPNIHNANMLNAMCMRLPCRKPYVRSCHGINGEFDGPAGHNAKLIIRKRGLTCCSANTTPLMISNAKITFGIALGRCGRML